MMYQCMFFVSYLLVMGREEPCPSHPVLDLLSEPMVAI